MDSDSSNLLALINQHFNRDELRSLCFDLGINFEEVPSGLSKTGEVRELILLFARQNRLNEMVAYCSKVRPHISWPNPHLTGVDNLLGNPVKPPQAYEPDIALIPAGAFLMGSLPTSGIPDYEQPQHEVFLPDYFISQFPITNTQFAEFLKHVKYPPPRGWLGTTPPLGKEQHPVINVSWFDALAYCQWLTKKTGRSYRLPSEAEWEKAARGPDGRAYPWGDAWNDNLCNHNSKGTTAVADFPEGASPFGCQDMIGNVREWTNTIWGNDYEEPQYSYPYCIDDGREDRGKDSIVYRIVRGSSFKDIKERHRCTVRSWYAPENKNRQRGFRVVIAYQNKGFADG